MPKVKYLYPPEIILSLIILVTTFSQICLAENKISNPSDFLPIELSERIPPPNRLNKTPGLYSRTDWTTAINATWGPGISTPEKLSVFTNYWNFIDSNFACFHGLDEDIWANVWNQYYSEVSAGVSKGRFSAILSHASMNLRESHTVNGNLDVWRTQLLPGVPLMYIGGLGRNIGHFGAALTPLPDSSLLVYKVIEDHPLGLVPGDVVLGYNRIPWKELYQQLLEAELPLTGEGWGSSPSSFTHTLLMGAGMNWHLFDTIDIAKYSTNDTLHLPTSVLIDQEMSLSATEQLDIPGIPIPDVYGTQQVSYGILDDTKIGYIYCIGWWYDVETEWFNAIDDLMNNQETIGLIIDFRLNMGGNMWLAYPGLELLFNERVLTVGFAERCNAEDHLDMCLKQSPFAYPIVGNPDTYYNKPIAVLTGPSAVSSGDQVALAMAFHPMSKFFGKPTSAAFNSPEFVPRIPPDFRSFVATADAYLHIYPGQYLTRDEFPSEEDFPWVDYEHVWLTREGVAQGRDDVVEAAKNWIYERDLDKDGFVNENDNCPSLFNPMQEDIDEDGFGDICDNCPDNYNPLQYDLDENGIADACEFICGDADNSEAINILDVVFILNYKYKFGPEPEYPLSADVNSDELINILDIVYILNYKYKDGPEPVCII